MTATSSADRRRLSSYGPTSHLASREYDDDGDGEDYTEGDARRPRRPSPDTLSYCRALPLSLDTHERELKERREETTNVVDVDDASSTPSLALARSALEEVRREVASLAGDEAGSEFLETAARVVDDEASLRVLVEGTRSYHLHLAGHRYGSHVVQTLLAEIGRDASDQLLREFACDVADELIPHAAELATHVCGAHVLRTLARVLAGAEVPPRPRRSKPRKKKKGKRTPDVAPESARDEPAPKRRPSSATWDDDTRAALRERLDRLTDALTGGQDSDDYRLLELVCHPSAGPLLTLLLRLLCMVDENDDSATASTSDDDDAVAERDRRLLGVLPPAPRLSPNSSAELLVHRALRWRDVRVCADVLYGLAGEPTGSLFLEAVLRACDPARFAEVATRAGLMDKPEDFVAHDVSNFVAQTALAACPDATTADALCGALMGCVRNGTATRRERRGVLWRLTERCAEHNVRQEELREALGAGIAALEADEKDDDKKTKKRHKTTKTKPIAYCVRKLLDARLPADEDGRLTLDVNGARTVHHLLRFAAPNARRDVVEALVNDSSIRELEALAKDGLGSRCVIDALLLPDNAALAAVALRDKLAGRWTSLAVHRVGHHAVRRLFTSLSSLDDKLVLARELAVQGGENRLRGCAMGRAVVEECRLSDLLRGGEFTWREAMARVERRREWLDDVATEKEGEAENKEGDGKKRRRRRKRRRRDEDEGEGDEKDDDDKTDENTNKDVAKTKTAVSDSVRSIMDAMIVPKAVAVAAAAERPETEARTTDEPIKKRKRSRRKKKSETTAKTTTERT